MANSYSAVAERWVKRATGATTKPALKNDRLIDEGDVIYSYGHHFEVARIIRAKNGDPILFLLNGDRFSNTTTRHQTAVRSAIALSTIDSVIIPHQSLRAAGILLDTVQLIDVQEDWWTEVVTTKVENPGHWEYDPAILEDKGGWINSLTGVFHPRTEYWGPGSKRPQRETCEECEAPINCGTSCRATRLEHTALKKERDVHIRARHGVWEEVPTHHRQTGRKRIVSGPNGRTRWDIVADDEHGVVYQTSRHRHWLGGSLIRAAVNERIMRRCQRCSGTGVDPEPWASQGDPGIGPMDEYHAERSRRRLEGQMDLMEKRGYWILSGLAREVTDVQPFEHWSIPTVVMHDECRECSGSGRVPSVRRRWAYYLSAFDSNETRPSYFFCELAPGAKPTTMQEALESLKPDSVKLAESMGREVKRQGDIFAIPMPGMTLRDLKDQGGVFEKNAYLLDTNHRGRDVVRVGDQTYVRGTLTHAPFDRRPDHKRVALGETFHLVVKNTVPMAA